MVGRTDTWKPVLWVGAAWAAALAWLVLPLDPFPDVIPVLGWLDDLAVLVGVSGFTLWTLGRAQAPTPAFAAPVPEPDGAPLDDVYDPIPVDELRTW